MQSDDGVNRPRIGYVGVGLMGTPMVKRLVELGYPVCAYDILPRQQDAARSAGATVAPAPRATSRCRDRMS